MNDLLYEKENETMELKQKYFNDLESGTFTIGYALQLGFNNIYLRLEDRRMEVGYLYRDTTDGHLEYSGDLTDYQLSTVCVFVSAYEEYDGYTNIEIRCANELDEVRFKEGE